MLNQQPLFIIPDSTDLTQNTVQLRLYSSEEISAYRLAKDGSAINNAKWEIGSIFRITANGIYRVEAVTKSGEKIQKEFSICFLGTRPSFSGGSGSASSPFLIETASQLNAMRSNLKAHYRLVSDIDLADTDWGIGWCPIGNLTFMADDLGIAVDHNQSFSGCLDGSGHTIKNVVEIFPKIENVGFFGYLDGTVKDLTLSDIYMVGNHHIGGVAGSFHGLIMSTCVSGKINGGNLMGGIVGEIIENAAGDTPVVVDRCEFEGNISGSNSRKGFQNEIGGIAAACSASDTTISNCVVNAQLEDSGGIYGICGCTPARIINCLARGRITTRQTLKESIVYGIGSAYSWDVNCENPNWGVYGCVSAWSTIAFSSGKLEDLPYNFGPIGIPPQEVSLVSPNKNAFMYNLRVLLGDSPVFYQEKERFEKGICSLSKALLLSMGWDFNTTWDMDENGWPKLRRIK